MSRLRSIHRRRNAALTRVGDLYRDRHRILWERHREQDEQDTQNWQTERLKRKLQEESEHDLSWAYLVSSE
jgi:hypothetical protein